MREVCFPARDDAAARVAEAEPEVLCRGRGLSRRIRGPYAVAKYRSIEYTRRLKSLLDTVRFDLLVCDFLPPLVNLPTRLPCPAVLFTHNVEAEIWRRHAETATGLAVPALFRAQWRRMQRFEKAALDRFDLVLAVSEADRRTFERLYAPRLQSRSCRPASIRTTSARPPRPRPTPGTWSSPAPWTGCRTRTA